MMTELKKLSKEPNDPGPSVTLGFRMIYRELPAAMDFKLGTLIYMLPLRIMKQEVLNYCKKGMLLRKTPGLSLIA
ncbi:MAG TPA: hypothetical protein PLZ52_04600, partial [Bacteroidales bacterium]|nr:hypothetical protein [Bacteroidales bacterium]